MLDLDRYINNSIKIKLLGKEYDILEPTMEMVMQVDRIEKDLTAENIHAKRIETALLLLNHNKQKKVFKEEELKKIPFEGITRLIAEISILRADAEKDPNLKSQSRKEK